VTRYAYDGSDVWATVVVHGPQVRIA
jgi:hypothetical protein